MTKQELIEFLSLSLLEYQRELKRYDHVLLGPHLLLVTKDYGLVLHQKNAFYRARPDLVGALRFSQSFKVDPNLKFIHFRVWYRDRIKELEELIEILKEEHRD